MSYPRSANTTTTTTTTTTIPQQQQHDQHDWDGKNKMTKTTSQAYSVGSSNSNSNNNNRQTNTFIQESSARVYFQELEKYLSFILSKEASEGVPSQRTAARQKLSRLNNLQFHELATDVYDELMRRNSDGHKSFLPLRDDFHPRRNQARQKLATLPITRFKDLASDVYHELKRRYPQATLRDQQHPQHPPTPPQHQHPQQQPQVNHHSPMSSSTANGNTTQGNVSQSTNIVPVKGTISVESVVDYSDDENDVERSKNGNIQSLDSLMADLGNMVKTPRPTELDNNSSSSSPSNNNGRSLAEKSENIENIRYEYEMKIASMSKRIQMLELSLDPSSTSLDGQSADRERQARLKQMQEEYRLLDNKYMSLSKEHKEQQVAVREVKDEIKQLIDELKNLSSKNETLRIQNENAENQIRQLTEESKSWKTKYESISLELRSFKTKSMMVHENQDLQRDYFLKPVANGAIGHQYIIEYQTAIDELMKTSRSTKPADVLFSMRTIVMACKSITTEVEDHEIKVGLAPEIQSQLYDIKKRFSNELSSLLSAAKVYAGGMGISPVSLLDAAAGNLTVTIVDLVKLLGMRPVSADSNNNGSKSMPPPASNHHHHHQHNNNNNMSSEKAMTPNQLSLFLKTETDHIVSSVQNLLGALRSSDGNLYKIITSIIDIVSNIVRVSKSTFSMGEGLKYRNQGGVILSDLSRCNEKIVQIRDTSFSKSPEMANAIAKRNLAQESYEIAKYTKELINMLDM